MKPNSHEVYYRDYQSILEYYIYACNASHYALRNASHYEHEHYVMWWYISFVVNISRDCIKTHEAF